MPYYYIVPKELFAFSTILEILFAIIALTVGLFALRIYRISEIKETRFLGISFLLISISYVISAIINLFVIYKEKNLLANLPIEVSLLGLVALSLYAITFISGLMTLIYATLKIRNMRAYLLMLGLGLIVIIASIDKVVTFRILSAFLLAFLVFNYLEEYSSNRNKKTLLILIAFILLLISNVDFIFSSTFYQTYILGHILELIAYIFILSNLFLTIKKS